MHRLSSTTANLAGLWLALVPMASVGCDDSSTDPATGDGDATAGDGDSSGDGSGDGDGDGSGDGDGDGDGSGGDGDGDSTGDGDGDGAAGQAPSLAGCMMFPADNPWNTDVSGYAVHAGSDAFIDSIGRDTTLHPDFGTVWDGQPIGIPYTTVGAGQPRVPVSFQYADESDPGPYPIPSDAPIEGGSDRHILVVDTDACMLYEMFAAETADGGASWTAGSGAVFDLSSNALRPAGWTSADAAGLPILPGLVRYDEVVERGAITHALRFTVSRSQTAYIPPATHAAGSGGDSALPPMGLRLRMKAAYDCSGFSEEVQVICAAMKTYGMFVADNGSNWYVSGAPDGRWSDDNLRDLKSIDGDAFEVVDTGALVQQ